VTGGSGGDQPSGESDATTGPSPAVVPEVVGRPAPPGVADLVVRGARVGVDAAGLLAAEVAGATLRLARVVLPPVLAERPLDAVEHLVDERRDVAKAREAESRDEALDGVRVLVGQIAGLVIDQIDMDELIGRIPIDEVIARVDVDAIISRLDVGAIANQAIDAVDIGAIVRDSTTGLAGETLDVVRAQALGADLLVARAADWLLRRQGARDLTFPEYAASEPLGPRPDRAEDGPR